MADKFDRSAYAALEGLIDRHGLDGVLRGMADICYEKQDHVQSNWQDSGLAKAWARAGRRIYATSRTAAVKGLP